MKPEHVEIGRMVRIVEDGDYKGWPAKICGPLKCGGVPVNNTQLPHIIDTKSIEEWEIDSSYKGSKFCRFMLSDLCIRI